MSLLGTLQLQNQGEWVELFALDLTPLGGAVYRFMPDLSMQLAPVVWQGETYNPLPIEITGYQIDGSGRVARPTAKLYNGGGIFSALIDAYNDLLGAQIVRKRTKVMCLDAVNFPGGVNPDADPNEHLPDDVFYVNRKVDEGPTLVEFELSSPLELDGMTLPRRKIQASICSWQYRDDNCGYTGPAVADAYDKPTTDINADVCSQTCTGCRLRYPVPQELPFGGFPASDKLPRM